MIYRKLDSTGDYVFGAGLGNFYKNQVEAVAQAVKTRLGLVRGEWFLNINAGTPYSTQILGAGMISKYDQAIKQVIAQTTGVLAIVAYASNVDRATRKATITCTINTRYGVTTIQQPI